jgi:hypothetical protein
MYLRVLVLRSEKSDEQPCDASGIAPIRAEQGGVCAEDLERFWILRIVRAPERADLDRNGIEGWRRRALDFPIPKRVRVRAEPPEGNPVGDASEIRSLTPSKLNA